MNFLEEFIEHETLAGILLIIVTILALFVSNSILADWYQYFLNIPIHIQFDALIIDKPLYLWVNDGLMAIFFLLIGLEVKREFLEGHLRSWRQASLAIYGALGGVTLPAIFYVAFNIGDATALNGWAIPTATDIAFALTILSLLGSRVPLSLKVFLMALAIIDDLFAIIVIAIFYTADLSWLSMLVAGFCLLVLIGANRLKIAKLGVYFFIGTILWVSVLKSGVHATLAGVALAFTIPMSVENKKGLNYAMAKELEQHLHPWVMFLIIPVFAFVNAGVNLEGMSFEHLLKPVPLGIFVGLFVGKQLGVFSLTWLTIRLGLSRLPADANLMQLYGVSVLTGIGFTMSLFINNLAFAETSAVQHTDKLAIMLASLASTCLGLIVLLLCPPAKRIQAPTP